MAVATCPDCGQKINLQPRLNVGDEVVCPHCEADLEVVNLDPPELDWAYLEPDDGDDWDDDEDWDDDDWEDDEDWDDDDDDDWDEED